MTGLAIWAFIAAQIADVWTTERVLRQGGSEANPVVRWMMDGLGRSWIVLKLALSGLAAWACLSSAYPQAIWIVTALTALVAANNERQVRK